MKTAWLLCSAALAIPAAALAYEKAFTATAPGTTEIKVIPERTLIVAERGENYFEGNNVLFGKLFRYISDNDVSMTTPVKAAINPGRMYFYVGSKDLPKTLNNTESVSVITEPERRVLSIGVRGGYSENNFEAAREKLFDLLAASNEWQKSNAAYAVFWDGPYKPGFMKTFEVHVPVQPKRMREKE